jgi:hypothetical protein
LLGPGSSSAGHNGSSIFGGVCIRSIFIANPITGFAPGQNRHHKEERAASFEASGPRNKGPDAQISKNGTEMTAKRFKVAHQQSKSCAAMKGHSPDTKSSQ